MILFTRNGPPLPRSIRQSLIRLVGEKSPMGLSPSLCDHQIYLVAFRNSSQRVNGIATVVRNKSV